MKDKGRQYLIDKIILLEKENTILRDGYAKVITTITRTTNLADFSITNSKIKSLELSDVAFVHNTVVLPVVCTAEIETDILNSAFHVGITFHGLNDTYRVAYAADLKSLLSCRDRSDMVRTIFNYLADSVVKQMSNDDIAKWGRRT